jgi:hypothetical protein
MPKRKALPRLTDRGRELISYVLNAAAFGTHGDDAELETMAKKLGTTAGRLRPTLRKLASQGWLTIEGRSAEFVYPTVAAIRAMNPNIDIAEAKKTVQRLHRK